jgi:ferritin-like metal-binding protein YciE
VAGEVDNKQVMDAALVAAAQTVEHYEIARHAHLSRGRSSLDAAARVLEQTLGEEKSTNEKLTSLAESYVNRKAA